MRFNFVKFLNKNRKAFFIIGAIVIVIVLWNFYGKREGMTPKEDFPTCGIMMGIEQNPDNRYYYFKNTLKDSKFSKYLKNAPKLTNISGAHRTTPEVFDLEYYYDFINKKPKPSLEHLTLKKWNDLDTDDSIKQKFKEFVNSSNPTSFLLEQIDPACRDYRNSTPIDQTLPLPTFSITSDTQIVSRADTDGGATLSFFAKHPEITSLDQFNEWMKKNQGNPGVQAELSELAAIAAEEDPGEYEGEYEEGAEDESSPSEGMTTLSQMWNNYFQ